MISSGLALWGTAAEHAHHSIDYAGPTIVVVTDFFTADHALIRQVRDRFPLAEVWVAEEGLRVWSNDGLLWPTAALAAASDSLDQMDRVALWYGSRLREMGVRGVFGSVDGTLSDVALPWMGDAVRRMVQAGFQQAGLGRAWVTSANADDLHWWLDGVGTVAPWPGVLSDAPWHWVEVTRYTPGHVVAGPSPMIPDRDAVGTILTRMRSSSIHLIDDPKRLPCDPQTRFRVTCEDQELKRRVERALNPTPDNDGPVVAVGIDALPSAALGQDSLVVAYKNSTVIGLAPDQAITVQVFDDHPVVWSALRHRLLGKAEWWGRTPFRLDQDQLSTHSGHFGTEQPHPDPRLRWLDRQPLPHLMTRWITEEQQALERIRPTIAQLEHLVIRMVEAYRSGSHIFYVGAGSAGRAGVMDAVELPPTFGIGPERIRAILAGGLAAFEKAREGVEDNFDEGRKQVMAVDVQPQDVVIGITAHGNTPFVLGALTEAHQRGCFTAAVVNNRGTKVGGMVDEEIFVDSGPELLLGSTRLKAGTVEKVILNLLSSLTMVTLGRSYDNLMIDFVATNDKLRERAVRVFMIATGQPRGVALAKLSEARGHLAIAMLMHWSGCSAFDAQAALELEGSVTAVLERLRGKEALIYGARS